MKFCALVVLAAAIAQAADVLESFNRKWTVPVAADWSTGKEDGTSVLRLVKSRGPLPGPRRPIQFALTDAPNYTRLTLEADVKPLARSLIIVFAYRDEAHFDYAHLSTDTAVKQPVHNGIFHVYGGERVRISSAQGAAAFAATGRWCHVKLLHFPATGKAEVTVDRQTITALHAVDLSLGAGKVGLGSFDETGEFKNVRITAQ
jgi:hypothetical protein